MTFSVALLSTSVLSGSASTDEDSSDDGDVTSEHWDASPEHVTIEYDEDWLQNYKPRLQLFHIPSERRPQYLAGWKATSPEHDTDVAVFFCYYSTQVGLTIWDSHLHDREPIYVFVDSTTGEIEEVLYTGYHWFKAETNDPPLDGDRPVFHVVHPWNHYMEHPSPETAYLDDVEVEPLTDRFDVWLRNGWNESLHPGAATNPWIMRSRESWWRQKDWKDTVALHLYRLYLRLGWQGGDETDL